MWGKSSVCDERENILCIKIFTVSNTRSQLTSLGLREQQKGGILLPKTSHQRTAAVQEHVDYCYPPNTAAGHTHSLWQLRELQVLPVYNIY